MVLEKELFQQIKCLGAWASEWELINKYSTRRLPKNSKCFRAEYGADSCLQSLILKLDISRM